MPASQDRQGDSANGLEVFFSSVRPFEPGGEKGDFNVRTVTRSSIDAPWSKPVPVIIGFGLPSLSRDGQRLYVAAPSAADPTVAHVFVSTRVDGGRFASNTDDDDDASDDIP